MLSDTAANAVVPEFDQQQLFQPENYYIAALEEIALAGGSHGLSLDCLWSRLLTRFNSRQLQKQTSKLEANVRNFILTAIARAPSSELAAYQLSDSTSQKSRTAIPLASLLRIEDNASLSASIIVLVASESVRRRQFSVFGNEVDSDCWSVLELAGAAGHTGVPVRQVAATAELSSSPDAVIDRLVRLGLLITRNCCAQTTASSAAEPLSDRRFWLTKFAPSNTTASVAAAAAGRGTDSTAVGAIESQAGGRKLRLLDESLPLRSQLLAGLSDKSACSAKAIQDSLAFGCHSLAETRSNLAWLCKRHLCSVESVDYYRAISLQSAYKAASSPASASAATAPSSNVDIDLDIEPQSEFKRPLAPPPLSKQRHKQPSVSSLHPSFSHQRVYRHFVKHKICPITELNDLAKQLDSRNGSPKRANQYDTLPKALVKSLDWLTLHGRLKLVTVRMPVAELAANAGRLTAPAQLNESNKPDPEPSVKPVQLYALTKLASDTDAICKLLSDRSNQLPISGELDASDLSNTPNVQSSNSDSQPESDAPLSDSATVAEPTDNRDWLQFIDCAEKISIFTRAQLAYEFCWYLVYGLPVDQGPIYPSTSVTLNGAEITLPPVYSDTNDWRRFVFPLYSNSKADHFPKTLPSSGWIHKIDIIMRMPLALYASLLKIGSCNSPLLFRYMSHPVLRWLPLATLPDSGLRALMLLRGRSLVLSRSPPFRVIGSMGLVYWLKRGTHFKDSGIMYITNRLTLLDTRPCKPVWDYIETQVYPKLCFEMRQPEDVLAAWRTTARIVLHTPIGYTDPDSRASSIFQLRFIECEDGDTIDGLLSEPFGDHLGVCGFSSKLGRALLLTDPRAQDQQQPSNGVDAQDDLSYISRLSLFGDMRNHLCELFNTRPTFEMPTTASLMRSGRRPSRSISAVENQQQQQQKGTGRGRGQRTRQMLINARTLAAKTREARRLARGSGGTSAASSASSENNLQHASFTSTVPTFSVESSRRRLRELSMALAGAAPLSSRIWSAEEDTVLLFCHLAYLLVFNDRTCKFSSTAASLIAELAPASPHSQVKTRPVCLRRFNLLFRGRRSFESLRRVRDSLLVRLRHSAAVRAWLVRPRAAWRRSPHSHPLAGDKAWREPHFRRIVLGLLHRDEAVELLNLTPPMMQPDAEMLDESATAPKIDDNFADEASSAEEGESPELPDDRRLVELGSDETANRVATHAQCMIDTLAAYVLICVQSYAEADLDARPEIDARLTEVINAYPVELAESALSRLCRYSELLGESPLVRAKHGDAMSVTSRRLKLRQGSSVACPPAVDAYFNGCAELNQSVLLGNQLLSESADVDINGPVAALCAAACLDSGLLQYEWQWSLERLNFLTLGISSDLFNEAVGFGADGSVAGDSQLPSIIEGDTNEDEEATTSSLLSQLQPPQQQQQQQQQQHQLLPLFRFADFSASHRGAAPDPKRKSGVPVWPPEFHCSVADAGIDDIGGASDNSRILRALLDCGSSVGICTDGVCGLSPAELRRRLGLAADTCGLTDRCVQQRQLADLDAELMRLIEARAVFLVGYNMPYLVHRKHMRACLVNLNPRGLQQKLLVDNEKRYILPTHWSDHLGNYRPHHHAALLRRILSASSERSGCSLIALSRSAGPTLGLVGLFKLLHQLRQLGCLTLQSAVPSVAATATPTAAGLFAPRPEHQWQPTTLFDDWPLVTVQVLPDAEFKLATALENAPV
ncbi:hypothetical protein BOX15_Mlig019555g5 [Macrostomum lignano]|uniref:B-block binding subunit of TFIIIC domain-containing protein n=1 Tax=Macrostomum lignano TaxID=282301 RepID=A0A267H7X9_9PLAT|nr:hypothetical protein BOX15_Mlig019555g5 [Macrostomum lignano]